VKRIVFAALAACAAIVGAGAQQADRAQTEALARRTTERLQALQKEADRLAGDEKTLAGDVRKLEVERQLRAEQLKGLDGQIAAVEADLASVTTRLDGLEQSEREQRPELRARLVEIYKLGRGRYMRLLFSTSDTRNLGQAARMVAALAERDRTRVATHDQTIKELSASRAALEERAQRLNALRTETLQAQRAVARAAETRDALVRDIAQKRDLNTQLAGELQASQQKLQATLREIASASVAARPAPAVPPAPAPAPVPAPAAAPPPPAPERPTAPVAPPIAGLRGQLDWPANGSVRSRFAPAAQPPSNGIDIATADGAAAVAVHGGTVAFAGPFGGFGNLVIVDHGSQSFSLYGDLLQMAVKKGDRLERGQIVGMVGPTPSGVSGLYFELRIDGQVVDPLQWLKKK